MPRGYYPDSEGKCISFINKIEKINNCNGHCVYIDKYKFNYYPESSDKILYLVNNPLYNDDLNLNHYNVYHYNEAMKNAKFPIKAICLNCKYGFALNEKKIVLEVLF